MKFPRKLRPICFAFALCGLFASVSAFAAKPASPGGAKPSGTSLPGYMVSAAGLDNKEYMKCVASGMKTPPDKFVVANVDTALDCQKN